MLFLFSTLDYFLFQRVFMLNPQDKIFYRDRFLINDKYTVHAISSLPHLVFF